MVILTGNITSVNLLSLVEHALFLLSRYKTISQLSDHIYFCGIVLIFLTEII